MTTRAQDLTFPDDRVKPKVEPPPVAPPPPPPVPARPTHCANCRRELGAIEPLFNYQNNVVCAACSKIISAAYQPNLAPGTAQDRLRNVSRGPSPIVIVGASIFAAFGLLMIVAGVPLLGWLALFGALLIGVLGHVTSK